MRWNGFVKHAFYFTFCGLEGLAARLGDRVVCSVVAMDGSGFRWQRQIYIPYLTLRYIYSTRLDSPFNGYIFDSGMRISIELALHKLRYTTFLSLSLLH
jgi:hypothetical protein